MWQRKNQKKQDNRNGRSCLWVQKKSYYCRDGLCWRLKIRLHVFPRADHLPFFLFALCLPETSVRGRNPSSSIQARALSLLLERRQHNTRVDRKETGRKETAKVYNSLSTRNFSHRIVTCCGLIFPKRRVTQVSLGDKGFLKFTYFKLQSCKFNKKNEFAQLFNFPTTFCFDSPDTDETGNEWARRQTRRKEWSKKLNGTGSKSRILMGNHVRRATTNLRMKKVGEKQSDRT